MLLGSRWLAGVLVFVVIFVAARAQVSPSATAGAGKHSKAQTAAQAQGANIYFYREHIDPQGIGRRALIYVDGQPVVNLSQGRYFLLQLSPGQHTFSGPDVQQAAPMTVEAGQEYFFKAKVDRSSAKKLVAIHNAFRIDLINPKLGEIDVAKLKAQEPDAGPKGPKATGTSY